MLDHTWRKSRRSGGNGQCVEVRRIDNAVQLRDSKDPAGPTLTFTRDEWAAFLDGAQKGEFDV